MPHNTYEKRRAYRSNRSPELIHKERERRRLKFQQKRIAVLTALGGKCARCGFSDERALQIDHVNGGGQADRREKGYNSGYPHTFFDKIMRDPEFLTKYQVLCANCNWIKRRERGEYNRGVGSKPQFFGAVPTS